MKKIFSLLFCLIITSQLFAQYGQHFSALNNYKVCIGAGTAIYWGAGRLYSLPKTNNPNEVTAAYSGSFYKTFSDRFEFGIRFSHADLAGLRFGKTWGETTLFKTTLDDISLQSNISLNNNLYLRDEFYTINLITGIGGTSYEAVLANIDPYLIRSSIGKGSNELGNIPNRQFAIYGTLGLGYHVRINQLISIGIDNFVNITSTKSLTGLTDITNVHMYDSYSVHVLTIGLRLGKGNKLFCPRI